MSIWRLEVPKECMYTNFTQILSNDFCDLYNILPKRVSRPRGHRSALAEVPAPRAPAVDAVRGRDPHPGLQRRRQGPGRRAREGAAFPQCVGCFWGVPVGCSEGRDASGALRAFPGVLRVCSVCVYGGLLASTLKHRSELQDSKRPPPPAGAGVEPVPARRRGRARVHRQPRPGADALAPGEGHAPGARPRRRARGRRVRDAQGQRVQTRQRVRGAASRQRGEGAEPGTARTSNTVNLPPRQAKQTLSTNKKRGHCALHASWKILGTWSRPHSKHGCETRLPALLARARLVSARAELRAGTSSTSRTWPTRIAWR